MKILFSCVAFTVWAVLGVAASEAIDIYKQKVSDLVAQMTLDEKISMLHGTTGAYVGQTPAIPRLGIPALQMNDGPQGFRDDSHPGTTTSFPSGGTISATWDSDAIYKWGAAMGVEFFEKGANVQLGPGMNLARVPTGGRNFEYMSGADPFLGYKLTPSAIAGIQSMGVMANAKHWIENNQETNRDTVSDVVDERTRHELYYMPFQGAVEAGVASFMCSYNKINGIWSCENAVTLKQDLKETLGFSGFVMSDWGATHSTSILQGLDQEMPSGLYFGSTLLKQVQDGTIPEEIINDSVSRILLPMMQLGIMSTNNTNTLNNAVNSKDHADIAYELSAQSHVLLQNNDDILPFRTDKPIKIAIVGKAAVAPIIGGGGSGSVFPSHIVSPYQGVLNELGLSSINGSMAFMCSTDYEYDVGIAQWGCEAVPAATPEDCCTACGNYPLCENWVFSGSSCSMYPNDAHKKRTGYKGATSGSAKKSMPPTKWDCNAKAQCVAFNDGSAAVSLAKEADVTVVVLGTFAKEGSDRPDLSFNAFKTEDCGVVPPGQDDLVSQIAAATLGKVVVAMTAPGAVLMPWKNQVSSILWGGFPGQEYGRALASVLFGTVNPSARLPFTMPNKENEVGFTPQQFPGVNKVGNYSEKMLIDYRWYTFHGVKPAFAFGHGLSYTTFQYSDLVVTGRDVAVTVTNTGTRVGRDVPQLYLEFPSAALTPPLMLKGFTRTTALEPGQSEILTFSLREQDLSVWDDVETHYWKIVAGTYVVLVGGASDNLPLRGSIDVASHVYVKRG